MNRQDKLVGFCVDTIDDLEKVKFVPSTFLMNLLLFQEYVMMSVKFQEFPQMIDLFGFEQTLNLLKSGALRISCDPSQIVMMGDSKGLVDSGKGLVYEVNLVVAHNHEEYISSCFSHFNKEIPLTLKKIVKLKRELISNLDLSARTTDFKELPEAKACRELIAAVQQGSPSIKNALLLEVYSKFSKSLDANKLKLKFHQVDSNIFKAETNLGKISCLNDYQCHELVWNALSRIVGVNQNIFYMEKYDAISSMNDLDISIFDEKLEFLTKEFTPYKQIEQFTRIMELKGFPNLEDSCTQRSIDLDKIIELRETKEIGEFRRFLSNINKMTDAEILDITESINSKIGNALSTKTGKALRFLVTQAISIGSGAIGLPPGSGLLPSFLNTFLIEKLFPASGPVSFINDKLPSIFETKRQKLEVKDVKNISIT
jgi:hypothetical protein